MSGVLLCCYICIYIRFYPPRCTLHVGIYVLLFLLLLYTAVRTGWNLTALLPIVHTLLVYTTTELLYPYLHSILRIYKPTSCYLLTAANARSALAFTLPRCCYSYYYCLGYYYCRRCRLRHCLLLLSEFPLCSSLFGSSFLLSHAPLL